jgi:hypothetical protein
LYSSFETLRFVMLLRMKSSRRLRRKLLGRQQLNRCAVTRSEFPHRLREQCMQRVLLRRRAERLEKCSLKPQCFNAFSLNPSSLKTRRLSKARRINFYQFF